MNARHQTGKKHKSDDVLEQLLSRTATYFQKYWRPVGLVLALVAVSLIGYQHYVSRRGSELELTWAEYAELPQVHPLMPEEQRREELRSIAEQCRRLLAERWETVATPWVLLRLGTAYLELGEPESAISPLERITKEYSDHYVYRLALPNLAAALEQSGEYRRAFDQYKTIAEKEYGNPVRWIDAGRNMELAGEREAAIEAYETAFDKTNENGFKRDRWELAEFRLKTLQRGGELLSPPPEKEIESPEAGEHEHEIELPSPPPAQLPEETEPEETPPEIPLAE